MRKQRAIYWKREDTPDRFGKFNFHPPVEIPCRWDDEGREYLDAQSDKATSRSIVYVDRIMAPGDRLKRGSIESTTPDEPLEITDAYEIQRFDQNPNLRNSETLLTAYL